ncbi:hypothetical protein HPB47_001401 [Ixodes persulcatus]|uniref:Uncharacterized protein n=1 Tax=Ixodes persulcatus TaxID=34615 RepID=A0AC60PQL4_IXOPE|nr:hypothetical protein HPB47_001401 [Ixodes persulcatus]
MNGAVVTCGTLLSVWGTLGWRNDLSDAPAFRRQDIRLDFNRRSDISGRQLTRGWNFQEEKYIRNVQWRPNDAETEEETCFFSKHMCPFDEEGPLQASCHDGEDTNPGRSCVLQLYCWYARPGAKENFQLLIPDDSDLWSIDSQAVYYRHLQSIQALTMEEREEVRINTIGQANNDTWFEERVGRLTASVFRKAVHCRKPEYLVRGILYPQPRKQLPATDPREYGRRMEPRAVEIYVLLQRYYDFDTTVRPTGLRVHRDYPLLASSPDGSVRNGAEEGLLEVKCPSSKINMTPEEACVVPEILTKRVKRFNKLYSEDAEYLSYPVYTMDTLPS